MRVHHSRLNVQPLYFWKFPFNIFRPLLTTDNLNRGNQKQYDRSTIKFLLIKHNHLYLKPYHHEPLFQISDYQCMASFDLAKFPNIFIVFSLTWELF